MKKEAWIQHIMESTGDIQPAAPNPFLYHKVINRLNTAVSDERNVIKLRTSLAIAASLLIIINLTGLWALKSKESKQTENVAIVHLSNEIGGGPTYNY